MGKDKKEKLQKKIAELKEELSDMQEQYESLYGMMQMTTDHMHEIQGNLKKANKHMLDSINYALRIQQALLDDQEQINSVFPQNFVMYKPKDILSGDLYWFKESMGMSFGAVIDCTGHGVPAAMLSVLVLSLINQTVTAFGITDPAEILTQLDTAMAQYTRNEDKVKQIKDGMDMVICRYDQQNRELVMAGAHRPLYLIRNGELHDFKGAKYALGSNNTRSQLIKNQVITVEPGDVVYMFSDGFPDQFGGEENRKFMVGRFKKLLLKISHLTLEQQEEILVQEFETWKGKSTQTDDVLIVGLKF